MRMGLSVTHEPDVDLERWIRSTHARNQCNILIDIQGNISLTGLSQHAIRSNTILNILKRIISTRNYYEKL